MIKRKVKQLLLLYCLIFLSEACTQEQNLAPAFLETMEKVEISEEESLARTLTTVTSSQPNSRSATASYGTLDYDKVYKRIVSEDQAYPNYMIRLYPPDGIKNSLEYLVMIGTDYGFRAYILQYQTTPKHINTISDPTIYTGYINILDLKRDLLAQNYFEQGTDTQLILNSNSRSKAASCACEYEYDLIVNQQDLSATLVVAGIACTCAETPRLGDP